MTGYEICLHVININNVIDINFFMNIKIVNINIVKSINIYIV